MRNHFNHAKRPRIILNIWNLSDLGETTPGILTDKSRFARNLFDKRLIWLLFFYGSSRHQTEDAAAPPAL